MPDIMWGAGNRAMRARLRLETQPARRRIESLPIIAGLAQPDGGKPAYVAVLRGLYASHAALRRLLPPLLVSVAGATALAQSNALAALASDLRAFGIRPPPPARLADLPHPGITPGGMTALGVLYVLEGSALAASLAGQTLGPRLGISPGRGGHFFCGTMTTRTRNRWRDLQHILTAAVPHAGTPEAALVCDGAQLALQTFESALRRRPRQSVSIPPDFVPHPACPPLPAIAHMV